MGGISGGMPGFNYAETFNAHSAEDLVTQLSTGLNKKELHDAGFHALMEMARNFEKANDPEALNKFKESAEKFSRVFPEEAKTIESLFPYEFSHIKASPPSDLTTLKDADSILLYVKEHAEKIISDPTIATRAHHMLHDLAQNEIAKGNVRAAFEIASQAAASIPLSDRHPLHEMDKAIIQGASKQFDTKVGAHFSSFNTSIVKGGNLHATQRVIDGKLTNSFDFKISHYARDELENYLNAIISNPKEFKDSLPKGFCKDVEIRVGVPQQYIRFDESKKEFTRSGAYCPCGANATEIVFEGVGKVIVGTNKLVGCMYNWIQVEMEPNLPPGEGVKKLHQMLSVAGVGPALGQQPAESDERMKIAQLYRAFYPSEATSFDTTKEFYQLSLDALRKEIEYRVPEMSAVFKKYLEDSPHLMKKIEIMPGKEIWGIEDFGQQIRDAGCYGLMSGVGNSGGWDSAKTAIKRLLTQGAMSSEQRFQSGVFKEGSSSENDLCSGGGDQVFARMVTGTIEGFDMSWYPFSGNAQILWDVDTVAQRVPYCFEEDNYGVKNRFVLDYDNYKLRPSLMTLAKYLAQTENEVMVKNSLDPSHIAGILVASSERKEDLIKFLVEEGLAEKRSGSIYLKANDKIAAEFIHVGRTFDQKMWG